MIVKGIGEITKVISRKFTPEGETEPIEYYQCSVTNKNAYGLRDQLLIFTLDKTLAIGDKVGKEFEPGFYEISFEISINRSGYPRLRIVDIDPTEQD